jgi:hypothetical protein
VLAEAQLDLEAGAGRDLAHALQFEAGVEATRIDHRDRRGRVLDPCTADRDRDRAARRLNHRANEETTASIRQVEAEAEA